MPYLHQPTPFAGLGERYVTDALNGSAPLAGFGWTGRKCCTRLGPCLGAAGHEVITRAALGSGIIPFTVGTRRLTLTLSRAEQNLLIEANVDVDFGSSCQAVTQSFAPAEQRKHALRATQGQSTAGDPTATTEADAEVRRFAAGVFRLC